MKRATLILLAAIGMLLGTSKLARAADYSGDCAGVSSWDGSGNADITDPGNCTISNDLSATGYINITASGTVNTQALTASDGYIVVLGGGTVTVSGDITTNAWNVIVSSPSDISLQNVYTSGTGYHDVRILANSGGSGSDQFVIGSAGAANGVGTIDASNSDGYDNIYISNGASGGISYSGTGILDVSASGGQAGRITLDTEDGTGNIVLNGGTIVADGSGYPAGDINLVTSASGAIVVSSNTTLSVQGSGPYPFIDLSSDTITLNANLTVTMSGGNIANNGEIGGITPNGSASIVAPTDPDQAIYFTPWVTSNNNLSITGTGTLAWNATGDYTGLSFGGNNLVVTANMIVHNTGNGVATWMGSIDGSSNLQPITVGNLQLYANSSASGDTAGQVSFNASGVTSLTGPVLLDASGTGGGDGGQIYFFPGHGDVPFGGSGNYFQANVNGSSTGGNAGMFETWGDGTAAYNLSFQSANGITASAQSGNGNGGSITISSDDLNFALSNASLHADGVGTGAGGTINIGNSTMEFTGTSSSITANGSGLVSGGTPTNGITIWTGSNLTFGSSADGDVALSANALSSSGPGGNITVSYAGEIAGDAGSLTVTGGASGNGGTISLTSGDQLSLQNTLDASAGSTQGAGGNITLTGYSVVTPIGSTSLISANGNGTGAAGTITVSSQNDVYVDDEDFKLNANASGSGNGGTINVTGQDVYVTNDDDNSDISVTAGTDGDGGTISITGDPDEGTVELDGSTVDASAGMDGDGDGGNITISSFDLTIDSDSTIQANGYGSGTGGNLTLTAMDTDTPVDLTEGQQLFAEGGDSGTGGTVTLSNVMYFDVDTEVTDDADDDASDVSASEFDGIISSNDPDCQKVALGSSTWPLAYFNCVNIRPNSPSTADGYMASVIASDLSGAIGANTGMNKIKLWVFNDIGDINSYFKFPGTVDQPYAAGFGDTRNPPNPSSNINSSIVENSPNVTGGVLSEFNLKEVSIHEMGHALDHLMGQTNQSASDAYNNFVQNDFLLLDYVGGVVSGTTKRAACNTTATTDGGPAPFANVSAVCSGTSQIAYTGMLNSAILRALSTGVFHQHTPAGLDVPAWNELYAQSLAVKAYLQGESISSTNYLYTRTTDWVLTSGYFSCTLQWANAVATGDVNTGSFTPSGSPTENYSSRSCSADLTGTGYTAITN